MMENPRPAGEKLIEDITNLFRLKKEENDTAIKDTRNLFRLKIEIKKIKDIVLRNIKNHFGFGNEEETYHKPVWLNNFLSNNYIEYKSNGDKNKRLSVEEFLYKIRPYLIDIINDLKNMIHGKFN